MKCKSRRVHLDATRTGDVGHTSLCGYIAVDTTSDVVGVTCKDCLRRLRAGERSMVSAHAVAGSIGRAIVAALGPTAGPPPVITPQLWAMSCRGVARCGACDLCRWERDAAVWHAVEPYQRRHRDAPDGRPRWPHVDAALVALAEWERHGRHEASACGTMLDRLRRGHSGGKARGQRDSAMLRRADDVVHVRAALEAAYPYDVYKRIGRTMCMAILMARTPGVLGKRAEYADLAHMAGADVGEVQALVKSGRKRVAEILREKGLVRS